jgi:hypothetical protein
MAANVSMWRFHMAPYLGRIRNIEDNAERTLATQNLEGRFRPLGQPLEIPVAFPGIGLSGLATLATLVPLGYQTLFKVLFSVATLVIVVAIKATTPTFNRGEFCLLLHVTPPLPLDTRSFLRLSRGLFMGCLNPLSHGGWNGRSDCVDLRSRNKIAGGVFHFLQLIEADWRMLKELGARYVTDIF